VLAAAQLYISFVLRSLHYKEETRQAVGDSMFFLFTFILLPPLILKWSLWRALESCELKLQGV